MKYAIYRLDTGLYCRWDEAVILFRDMEQVNMFMEEFSFFFADVNPEAIKIFAPDVIPGAMIIAYEDISEESKEEAKQYYRRKMEESSHE